MLRHSYDQKKKYFVSKILIFMAWNQTHVGRSLIPSKAKNLKNAISPISLKKTEKVPQILFILYFYIILFNCNHLEPGGWGGNGFHWNGFTIHILADFTVKNLVISKIHLLVNHPWPITQWSTISFISTMYTHGASQHCVKVVKFTVFRPKTQMALPRP